MTERPGESRFEIVSCAHTTYETHDELDADAAVARIAELFQPWGGQLDAWTVDTRRTSGQTDTRLAHWTRRGQTSPTLLAWISHGETDQNARTARVFVSGEANSGLDSARVPEDLAGHIRNHVKERGTEDIWTIVLVEACGGRLFVQNVRTDLEGARTADPIRRVLLIGSGAPSATQFLGTFARDLAEVLEQVTEDALPIVRLAALLSEFHDDGLTRYTIAPLHLGDSTLSQTMLTPRTAVWNDYRELLCALRTASVDSDAYQAMIHYTAKGTGTDLGEFAWRFVGRRVEREAIFGWLRSTREIDTHHLLVVCGPPGSGKSALLGSVLIDCHPELARALEEVIGERNIEPPVVELPEFDLVLHLTGATVRTVAAQILAYLNQDNDVGHLQDAVTEVQRAITAEGHRLLILADALDESAEPVALAHFFDELLRRSRVRMIIGTRAGTSDVEGGLTDLLVKDGTQPERRMLWLPLAPEDVTESLAVRVRDPALREVVREILQEPRPTAAKRSAEHQFLWAAMAAEEINAQAPSLPEQLEALTGVLDTDHAELFRRALDRIAQTTPLAREALLALALAHGRGLPRQDRIWEETTSALAPGEPVTQVDLNTVLATAGAYVMLDHENGQGVYRLVHRVLQDHLLAEVEDLESKRLYVFRRLLGHIRDDRPLNPYFRQRLSAHAASAPADAWTELAGRLDVLDRLDPYAVAGDALRTGPADRLPPPVLGMMTTAYLARRGRDDDRPGLRKLGEEWIAGHSRRTGVPVAGAWSLRWSLLPRRPAHLPVGEVGRSPKAARAMVLVPQPGGRSLIAVAAGDTTVRIWDPITGQQAGPAFDLRDIRSTAGPGSGVQSLVALTHHGRRLLAGAAVGGGGVVVWDPRTGQLVPTSIPKGGPIDVLAAYCADDGSARLVIARSNGSVDWLDPMTGDHVGRPRSPHGGRVSAVIVAEPGSDGPVVVVLTSSGRIEAWEARTGRRWGRGAQLDGVGVTLVLLDANPDEIVLVTTDGAGRCHRCTMRPDSLEVVEPGDVDLVAWSPETRRTAVLRPGGGRRLLATSDHYGEVRLWDLDHLVGVIPVTGWPAHRDPVDVLVANDREDDSGWALATVGKGIGVVRVWLPSALTGPAATTSERYVKKVVLAGDHAVLLGRRELTLVDARQGSPSTRRPTDAHDLAALGRPPRIVSATGDQVRCLYVAEALEQSWPHPSRLERLTALTLDDADYLFTLDSQGAIRRLNIDDGQSEPDPAETGVVHSTGMVAYDDGDGVVVVIGGAASVARWRYRRANSPRWAALPAVDCMMRPQALAALSADASGSAVLFVVTSGQVVRADDRQEQRWGVEALKNPQGAAAWRTDGGDVRLAVGDTEGQIHLFDGAQGVCLHVISTGLAITSLATVVLDGHRSLVVGAGEGAVAVDVDVAQNGRP